MISFLRMAEIEIEIYYCPIGGWVGGGAYTKMTMFQNGFNNRRCQDGLAASGDSIQPEK